MLVYTNFEGRCDIFAGNFLLAAFLPYDYTPVLASALGPLGSSKKSQFLSIININIIVDVFHIEKMIAKETKLTLQKSAVPIWPIKFSDLPRPVRFFISCWDLKYFIKNFGNFVV